MSRAERAKELFEQGYACSQSVALAFSDVVEIGESVLTKMMLPFGGGFGRLRLVCGAVSGMTAICGLVFAKAENSSENKMSVYAIERELCAKFEAEFGSLICESLLSGANLKVEKGGNAEARTTEYYKKRPCSELVKTCAQILVDYLNEKGVLNE